MIVAKMRAADMPVEILGLEIERETIRQRRVQRLRHRFGRVALEVGRGLEVGLGHSRSPLRRFRPPNEDCCIWCQRESKNPTRVDFQIRPRTLIATIKPAIRNGAAMMRAITVSGRTAKSLPI